MSSATLPVPMTSRSGVHAGQVLPRHLQPAPGGRPHGVDDRVEVPGQLVDGHVGADVDAEHRAHARVVVEPAERLPDPLGAGVVGRDAVADQPARRGQPVDERDGRAGVQQEQFRGIEARGPGADDGDVEAAEVAGQRPVEARPAPLVEERPLAGTGERRLGVAPPEVPGVEVDVDLLGLAERVRGDGGVDRAGVGAGAAVDADRGVNGEHRLGVEVGGAGRRPDAVDRAGRDAGGVLAAVLRDDVGHGCPVTAGSPARTSGRPVG
jgi:hypothetical protein